MLQTVILEEYNNLNTNQKNNLSRKAVAWYSVTIEQRQFIYQCQF